MATTLELRVQVVDVETNGLCIQVPLQAFVGSSGRLTQNSSVDAWRDFDKL